MAPFFETRTLPLNRAVSATDFITESMARANGLDGFFCRLSQDTAKRAATVNSKTILNFMLQDFKIKLSFFLKKFDTNLFNLDLINQPL
jgi:hypothetical protein